MFKTKYRIVTTQEGRFQIEYRYWWFPSWGAFVYEYQTIQDAKAAIDGLISVTAFKPKVVYRAS